MKISKKFLKMSEIYRIFSQDWEDVLNFDEKSLEDMYVYESRGIKNNSLEKNGYFVGKQYMDVHIEMWRKDLKDGILVRQELYKDGKYPKWFLDKVIN